MNDLTLDDMKALLAVFNRAGALNDVEQALFDDIKQKHDEREEVESMEFDDCVGGACKL